MSAEQPGPTAADFVESGLASMGIEADEIEMAVIRAAHQLYWPEIVELLSIDTGGVPPEPDPDLSSPP
jgi:hypothetical protein